MKCNESDRDKNSGHTYVQWMVAILAATTLLSYGLQSGWISPMTKVLQSESSPTGSPLTDIEISWVASTMAIAAVFGVPLYTYIADKFGRKVGVIAMAVPQALCWIIKLSSSDTVALIIARACGGVPAGGCFNLIPMYIKEISQDNIRGALVSVTMMFQNIGLLAMYAMGGYMGYNVILWIALSVSAGTIVFMMFAPESPAFLVKQEKFEEAARTIAKLRGLPDDHKIVLNEVEVMKNEEMYFKTAVNISFVTIFKNKAWCKSFVLCMLMLTALDANGYFTILNFAWTIMTQSGVTVNPELQTLSIPALMILGSLVSVSLVEKLGRKPLLTAAYIISALAMVCLGSVLLAQDYGVNVPSWVAVVAIVASVWAYAGGILPMTYVVLSEIFNFQVRAKLIGVIVTYGWFVSFVQLAVYGPICNLLGMYTMFYIFAGVNVFGIFVSVVLLPETKGKTVEEIENILIGKRMK